MRAVIHLLITKYVSKQGVICCFCDLTPVLEMQLTFQTQKDTNLARKAHTSFIKITLRVPSTLQYELACVWLGLAIGPRTDTCSVWIIHHVKQVKGKVYPITGHESPEGEQRYSCTLSLTLVLDGGGWSMPHPGHFTPGRDPVSIVQKAGQAPGLVWTGAKNLVLTGIRSPDSPVCSESLYRLRYPNPLC